MQQALELEKGVGLGSVWLRPAAVVPFMSPPHFEAGDSRFAVQLVMVCGVPSSRAKVSLLSR